MVKVSSSYDVAGVLMQLCCGALMWLGQSAWAGPVDALSYFIVIAVLRRTFFVFPHCCKHTKDCTDRGCPRSHVRHHSNLDLAVHMWLCCHGDSEYRLDDQVPWLHGKSMSTKQLVALHEQPGSFPFHPHN